MNLKQSAKALTFAAMVGIASLSAVPAFAADGDAMTSYMKARDDFMAGVKPMANKDGMVSKKDFMTMMEKKFDAMDKGKKGMLPIDDVMRIFGYQDKP